MSLEEEGGSLVALCGGSRGVFLLTPARLLLLRLASVATASDDLHKLRTIFVNERFAPELLPHEDALVKRVQDIVDDQVRTRRARPSQAHSPR